jgi:hypothetical protein
VVEPIGGLLVSGPTQVHTATADITAIAINKTIATTGDTPFLIIITSELHALRRKRIYAL